MMFIAVLYGRTATFDFSYLDDDVLILDDLAFLSAPGSVTRAFTRSYFPGQAGAHHDHSYYRPLVTVSYAMDAAWGGTTAAGYHRSNVVFHAVAAALLFLLLVRFGYRDNVALFGAFLFAAHPALTEAVAWIPGRNDVLLAVFAFASWLLLPGMMPVSRRDGVSAHSGENGGVPASRGDILRLLAHLLAWLGALLAKETALILPLVWAAQLRWRLYPTKRGGAAAELRSWVVVAGWFATGTLYVAARTVFTSGAVSGTGGATVVPALWSGLSATRVLSNLPSLLGAIGKLFLPVRLSVLAVPGDTSLWPGVAGAAALLLAARFIPVIRRRHLLFGLGCTLAFLIPGLPASNLLVLENRLYLPAVGMVLVACELSLTLPLGGRLKAALAGTLVVVLAMVSFSYAGDFRDRLAFARAAVEQSPHSSLAHRNLGVACHVVGDSDCARREYQAALAEDAAEPVAHNNLGVLFMAQGQLPDAERELRRELAINPDYAPAHHNLAQVLMAAGKLDEAAEHWERTLALNPRDPAALQALAEYYGPRDPARASRLRALLNTPGPPAAGH